MNTADSQSKMSKMTAAKKVHRGVGAAQAFHKCPQAYVGLSWLPYEGLFPEMLPLYHPANQLLLPVDTLSHQNLRGKEVEERELVQTHRTVNRHRQVQDQIKLWVCAQETLFYLSFEDDVECVTLSPFLNYNIFVLVLHLQKTKRNDKA